MYNHNVTYVTFALFLILFCDTTSSECMQLGPCTWSLVDGSSYNLINLADEKWQTDSKYNWTVYFNPCKNVKIKVDAQNTCGNGNEVSLCLHNNQSDITINLETISETRMKLSDGNSTLLILKIHHDKITSIIYIICFLEKTYFKIVSPINNDTTEYYFILASPYACKIPPYKESPKRLSGGSILIILFFTFASIYFIGGIVTLKLLRGATGWEMLPNHEFWCDLPALVRDGVVFTFNCCRADSYERI